MSKRPGNWFDDAFFVSPPPRSLDGGETNHGVLWHSVSPRWGHSMHAMCSYHGMFPAKVAHYFIQRFSRPGQVVLDPFSGRGTTALQARVEGRVSISNDLSPLAYVLTKAKADPPSWESVNARVTDLEGQYKKRRQRDIDVPSDIRMLFHPHTLKQLAFVRDHLLAKSMSRWSREELMIAGATAGILHGLHRTDGTSRYLSISMPNTFSMSPSYVRRYIRENNLRQIEQNVFECLRDKLARLYLDSIAGIPGTSSKRDASTFLNSKSIRPGSVDLVVTSPPYLRVVNYGTANWIRLWWLGLDEVSRHAGVGRQTLDAQLDHQHTYETYVDFMHLLFLRVRRVLKRSGVAVLIVGHVSSPTGISRALARDIWADVGDTTGLQLIEFIEDSVPVHNKVSRIWGDTKGRATEREGILILGRDDGEPRIGEPEVLWDEPYRDGGPDAAHTRAHTRALAS
jgi:site-specific DNA-methyltransferase (adenine-specific)